VSHHPRGGRRAGARARAQAGYTFAELLAVAALLLILLVVALPRLVVPEMVEARVPASALAADLRLAQRLAIARRADHILEFTPATPPYAQYTVRAAAGGDEPDFPKAFATGVVVDGPPQVTFRPDGSATAGGTITVTSSGATATVQVVGTTGRVTVSGP
jgi:type II secretory pathway pseudopilin PulG